MPPSHHSSSQGSHSSHSSSHSSHSSSSHSSHSSFGGSSHSSFGSSHSSHSSGSHSYGSHTSHSTYGHSSHSSRPTYGSSRSSSSSWDYYDRLHSSNRTYSSGRSNYSARRPRHNQPQGYHGTGVYQPMEYHCRMHDYVYYSVPWTDKATGVRYEKGYYDENGAYYENMKIRQVNENSGITKFVCKYCGTEVKAEWKEGEKPVCPNCNAQLVEADEDYLIPDLPPQPEKKRTTASDAVGYGCGAIMLAIILGIVGFFGYSCVSWMFEEKQPAFSAVPVIDSLYVAEIGRTCPYFEDTGEYYDEVTDCYFWLNDWVEPPIWQYWYEGISSEFEASGVMEFDEGEERWYIEIEENKWIVLPNKYVSDRLWHICSR